MDCPVCDKAMITAELHEVEVDYCASCTGIWLDAGELEILLGDPKHADSIVSSFQPVSGTNHPVRKCPICRKKMEIVDTDGTGVVLLDRCRLHHGLWFDRGELPSILQRTSLDSSGRIRTLLEELFIRNPGKE